MSRSSNQSTSAGVVCFFTAFTHELLCNCDLLSGPARRHLEASGVPVENRYFPMQTHYILYMLAWMCLHSFSGEFSLVLSLMGLIVNVYTSKIGVNLDSYSKGEFGLGQHELNVKYAEILEMADRHVVYKQVCIICFHFWYLEKVMATCLISVILLLPMANVICTLSFCHLVPLLSLTFLQKSFKCAFVVSLAPFTPCGLCDLDTWMNWHKPISTLLVQCLKELADATGVSVTFMAKPDAAQPGSSCHIHLSLWKDGHNIFAGNHSLGSTKCRSESDDFWSHPSQFLSIHKSNLMQWTSGTYWKLWWRCLLHSCSLQEGQWYWVCFYLVSCHFWGSGCNGEM